MMNGQDMPIGMDRSLLQMDQDIEKQEKEAVKEKVRVIEELTDFNVFSWGYSEPLKVTKGKEV